MALFRSIESYLDKSEIFNGCAVVAVGAFLKKYLPFLLLMTLISCASAINEEQARAACDLTSLPMDSKHFASHGGILHVYPPKVWKSYTGCVIVASGRENPATFSFVNGELKRIQGRISADYPTVSCVYENRALVFANSSVKGCPKYEEIELLPLLME